MATRTDLDPVRAAELFHALSDGTRLSILHCLRFGERCVCDMTDALDAAQSRLSFHLKVLKDAGLVPTVARVGGCITPSIPKPWLKWRPQSGGLLRRPHRRSGRTAAADRFWFIYQRNL